MKNVNYLLVAVSLSLMFSLTENLNAEDQPIVHDVVHTDVCSILADPSAFLNKNVTVRGLVFKGVDHANISDSKCRGRAIEVIIQDSLLQKKDIRLFYRRITKYGFKAMATLTGKFKRNGGYDKAFIPYVLDIHYVTNILPPGDR